MQPSERKNTIYVLLIDDEPRFQQFVQVLLSPWKGYKVETCGDPQEALTRALHTTPDVILLDFDLPRMNGLTVLQRLRQIGVRAPVIMITGVGAEQAAVEAIQHGAYDYLVKSGNLYETIPLVIQKVLARVEVDRQLESARARGEELEREKEALSDLLSHVSHQLRTPLVASMGYTELMLTEKMGPLTEKQRKGLEISMKSQRRLERMIEVLLRLSRVQLRRHTFAATPFDLVQLATTVGQIIQVRCKQKDIKFTLAAPNHEVVVEGDEDLLENALLCLLENAVKFTPPQGRVSLTVELVGSEEIQVSVEDTGCGIAPQDFENLFRKFWSRPSPHGEPGGLGLGLAIVKEVIDLHRSHVKVESRVGQGTTFRFSLPIAHAKAPPKDERPVETVRTQRSRQVLVVDDEPEVIDWLNTILQDAGHGVQAASSFRDAERLLQQKDFDVMLLDILLSDGNGIDFLKSLRDQRKSSHVYMITAVSDPRIHEQAREAGAQGVLLKPFRADELLRAVDQAPAHSTT